MSISPPTASPQSVQTEPHFTDTLQKQLASLSKRLLAGLLARACRRTRALFDLPEDYHVRRLCLDTMDAVIWQAESVASGKTPVYLGTLAAFCRAAADVLDEANGSSNQASRILALARELVEVVQVTTNGQQGNLEASAERITRLLGE